MSEPVVIVAAGRTAIGAFGGVLANIPAHELGAQVIRALLEKTGVKGTDIDEVILGQVITAGCGQNPARQAVIAAGLPVSVPAITINKVCGSGLKAVMLGAQAIRAGDAEIIIAGGQENMSAAPHLLPGSRQGQRMGNWPLVDSMLNDGLIEASDGRHMGAIVENLASEYGIPRSAQDEFSANSQQRTEAAQKAGRFREEIIPLRIPQKKGEALVVETDEYPRAGTTAEKLGVLKPAFAKDGSVTAGNASGLNDGAAAVMLMRESAARRLGLPVLARIKAYASAAVEPTRFGIGPVPASQRCLDKAGWKAGELELVEANEAFALQSLCVLKDLGLDPARVNVNGGAIALGHPIGASGARVLVTLVHEMRRRDAKRGLATLCIGGGQGVALAVERD
ncbi:MAG: acetyl-CoA C-acetyltransferase [Nevskiales bacterium]